MEHSDGRNNERGRAQWLTDTALVRDESSSVAGAVSTLQGSGRRHGGTRVAAPGSPWGLLGPLGGAALTRSLSSRAQSIMTYLWFGF